MSKGKARVFVPLTKVDEEKRLVYGVMTQEVLDKSGEMMDYAKSKPHFEKWSNDIHEASGGLSKGNLRVMHGLSVAGKVTEMDFNDEDKTIEICTKVVDDGEWNKVLEGCYTGFSVGGSYGKKWKETIDGSVVQKYEAKPNEVSLVDNPCVPSATFALVKADGAEEEIMFKAAESGVTASGPIDGEDNAPGTGTKPAQVTKLESDPKIKKPAPTPTPGGVEKTVTNEEVAAKATELAKAAGEDKVWTDFIEAARDELMKADQRDPGDEAPEGDEGEEGENKPAAEDAGEATADDAGEEQPVEKVTPVGVKQAWVASDGKSFDKKADAVTHEEELAKAATPPVEPTEAELLAARLKKALDPDPEPEEDPELPLLEDFDRLSKAVQALSTPFENGEPKLEKGMYTINRFSSVLSDMASLSRSIKAEGKREGNDSTDSAVSAEILSAATALGTSFISYATQQVTELLAGMDDDVVVSYHDYYYNAVQVDPENGLAKDVCSLVNDLREPAKETRETLAKAFGLIIGETLESDDELSPPMQKRFSDLEADNQRLAKVATDAVEAVEALTKRVDDLANAPMPRAPNGEAVLPKDGTFLGKAVGTGADKMEVLKEMLAEHGADGMATLMIKASQASGGHKLNLKQ